MKMQQDLGHIEKPHTMPNAIEKPTVALHALNKHQCVILSIVPLQDLSQWWRKHIPQLLQKSPWNHEAWQSVWVAIISSWWKGEGYFPMHWSRWLVFVIRSQSGSLTIWWLRQWREFLGPRDWLDKTVAGQRCVLWISQIPQYANEQGTKSLRKQEKASEMAWHGDDWENGFLFAVPQWLIWITLPWMANKWTLLGQMKELTNFFLNRTFCSNLEPLKMKHNPLGGVFWFQSCSWSVVNLFCNHSRGLSGMLIKKNHNAHWQYSIAELSQLRVKPVSKETVLIVPIKKVE